MATGPSAPSAAAMALLIAHRHLAINLPPIDRWDKRLELRLLAAYTSIP